MLRWLFIKSKGLGLSSQMLRVGSVPPPRLRAAPVENYQSSKCLLKTTEHLLFKDFEGLWRNALDDFRCIEKKSPPEVANRCFRPRCPNGAPAFSKRTVSAKRGIYSVCKERDYATNFAEDGGGEWKESGDLGPVSNGGGSTSRTVCLQEGNSWRLKSLASWLVSLLCFAGICRCFFRDKVLFSRYRYSLERTSPIRKNLRIPCFRCTPERYRTEGC